MTTSDWPAWLAEAARSWHPASLVSPQMINAMRPVADLFGFRPAVIGKELLDAAASRLVGRRLTIVAGDQEITLVVRSLQVDRAPIGLTIGQLGDLHVEAEDVLLSGGVRIGHLGLDVRNLHVQPTSKGATVVAAPIRWRAVLDQDVITNEVARLASKVEVELGDAGTARVYRAGRRSWGHVDVVPRVDGRTLVLDPTSVGFWRFNLKALGKRLRVCRFELPEELAFVHITNVDIEDRHVVVEGVYEEWRTTITARQVEELLRRIHRHDGSTLHVPLDTGPDRDELSAATATVVSP
jgi:hypothetical protein